MNEIEHPRQFAYEKLSVWQDARVLIRTVYDHTRAFPKSEAFGLTSQLNRAVVSVACNLAEGSARMSAKDQAHFSQIAYSSLMEVSCLLTISSDLNYIPIDRLPELRQQILILSARIHKLRQTQLARTT